MIRQRFADAFAAEKTLLESGVKLSVRISDSNSKMGAVASVSLLPLLTCPSRCNESCASLCYAAKLANLRPAVRTAYAINTALAMKQPDVYWNEVDAACKKVKWFRFHVSGDILDADYLRRMIETVRNNTHCQFLCFTKRYELINEWLDAGNEIPNNLHLLMSGWGDMKPVNPHYLPETNVILRGSQPDPAWKLCGGNCYNCACRGLGCWQAQPRDVIAFHQH